LNRACFLSSGVRGAAVVTLGATTAGLLVDSAGASVTQPAASGQLTDLDLALGRLAVGAEILAAEFYTQAIASRQFGAAGLKDLKRALFNEQEHLTAVSQILAGAGQTPETADDFDISFPKGTFASRESIAKFGVALETTLVGAYLGAVDSFAALDLKTTAARIAASESHHLSVFGALAADRPIGVSFPVPIDYETASTFLDQFLS
jgi:hypothetical protein